MIRILCTTLAMLAVWVFTHPALAAGTARYRWSSDRLLWQSETVGTLRARLPEGLAAERSIERLNDRLFRITHRLKAKRDLTGVSFRFEFVHQARPVYLMIPAVSYNGNHWGQGNEPKGFVEHGVVRTFEYRRAAVPGATYSEADRHTIALWGQEQRRVEDLMFSCALEPEDGQVTHSLIFPDMESPNCYSGRDVYTAGYTNKASFPRGAELTITSYLFACPTEKEHRSVRGFLDSAWQVAAKPAFPMLAPEQLWQLAMDYAGGSLWSEEGPYKGFGIGLRPDAAGGFAPRASWKYEIGWCGNNGLFASAFLQDYLVHQRRESLDKALACLDTWSTGTVLSNGLFITHYDNILTKQENLLDACNLGGAAMSFFDAAELCSRVGRERPTLRTIAFGICDFMVCDQQASGQYGKAWAYNGECRHREGTIGAFLIPPMLEAYRLSRDDKYLRSARRAFEFYLGQLLRDGYTTAGALDTWCIDCESALPLLRSAMMLNDLTGEAVFLDHAETASYYIASWQWHYCAAYPPENDFVRYGYSTFGSSGVSAQHHHLSSHTVCAVVDWLELSKRTGHPVWRERARALWRNCAQLISDGTLRINGRLRPRGSQNEAFFQSNWCFYTDKTHSINDWLVAWPSAFRLEVLRRVKDWDELR